MNKRIRKKKGLLRDPLYDKAKERWLAALDEEVKQTEKLVRLYEENGLPLHTSTTKSQ